MIRGVRERRRKKMRWEGNTDRVITKKEDENFGCGTIGYVVFDTFRLDTARLDTTQ